MAIGLAEAGADIIATASSLQPGGSEVEKQVRQLGKECFCYPCEPSVILLAVSWVDKAVGYSL